MSLKQTIILSNLNERELFRSLSLNGKDLFNVKVFSAFGLTKEVLNRNGSDLPLEVIDDFKAACIVYKLIKDISYFSSKTFSDAKNIVRQLNVARCLCRGNEKDKLIEVLGDGEFKDKNNALLELYLKYNDYLSNNGLIDNYGLINKVINNDLTIDANYICLKETALSPIEEKLIEVVSNGTYKVISILDLYGKQESPLNKIEYDNAYGKINEIENIISTISNNHIKYDDVLLVLNDASYIEELLNYKEIPATYSIGYPITLSNGLKLYELLVIWDENYNSLDYLKNIVTSEEFDAEKFWANISSDELSAREKEEIINAAGYLRISTEYNVEMMNNYKSTFKDDLRFFELVDNFAKEFSNGYSYIINTYTKLRTDEFLNKLDVQSVNKITSLIDDYLNNIENVSPVSLYEDVISLSILKEFSKQGHIAITDLNGALAINRKHIFILGLSSSNFPGSPKENYLLLDSDLKRFNEDFAITSDKSISNKKDLLMEVISIANCLGSKIYLSYSGYNLTELKEENPSSMLYEIFKKERGSNATIDDLNKEIGKQHHYFEVNITNNKALGNLYLEGKDLNIDISKEDLIKNMTYQKEISPSAAEKFFECPFRFYLRYVLGLKEEDNYDPFNILPSNVEGELVHSCMEDYGNNSDWSEKDFLNNANNKFDNYLKTVNPIHTEGIENLRTEYLRMAKEGYESDPKNIVRSSEEKLGPIKHESGLMFGGRVDRIEKLEDGSYIIVDYKTYKDFRNIAEDIDTCFQVVLYAYVLSKQENVKVDRCEYRYLRNPGTVVVHYNDEIKKLMDQKIDKIKQAFDSGVFDYAEDKAACKYCPYVKMCGVNSVQESEEQE